MAVVPELSNVERTAKIETSDGRWCQIHMGDKDKHVGFHRLGVDAILGIALIVSSG